MFATASLSAAVPRALSTGWWAPLSIGAAAIHFAVIPDHLQEWWAFGLFFAILGWFQVMWPIAYRNRPSPGLAWLAIAVNAATVVLWAWSRTAGLPLGPGMPEAIGAADVVATTFEVALAVGLLLRAASASGRAEQATSPDPRAAAVTLAYWAAVAALATAAIGMAGG